ncbi:MAG: ATP-binding protein [Deltaproteobacteria bacterium]|nr:ATP-binding protein [Deltaproteobacteria bacterium]
MPHQRFRFLEVVAKKALGFSTILGLIGQRQVGKTTLAQSLRAEKGEYISFDSRDFLRQAESEPEVFLLNRKRPFVIDECQLCPVIFPALKEAVRLMPERGRFILTGSVRFSSRKAIRESLTGRILNLEILPMTIAEVYSRPLPSLVNQVLEVKHLEKFSPKKIDTEILTQRNEEFFHYIRRGGLPGICFGRNEAFRKIKFESHIETLLERDLRLLSATTLPLPVLKNILETLSTLQGQALDLAAFSRKVRITPKTLNSLLQAFESMFLIRRLLPLGGGIKKPVFYFEDQGMASYLCAAHPPDANNDLLRGLFANLRASFQYRPDYSDFHTYHYRTRGGAEIPLVFRGGKGTLGILPFAGGDTLPPAILGSSRSFCKNFTGSRVLVISYGQKVQLLDQNVLHIPLGYVI